ncbi:dipeptidyl-peptidase 3 family protein [Flammeovirga agarivorans]|uniref:Zn-dependent hydrolase n=1 Tax=Flammeovirga agarivorans TaxID=2726742 RepID=A0A7X8SGH1_9BACT|nr:Zn-dependent hydrolase [Flammeovirga agarivorans]NLR89781.1 Zn-dependent hydrolase [Flammeovirga agarivorans]
MKKTTLLVGLAFGASFFTGCATSEQHGDKQEVASVPKVDHLVDYTDFTLTADLSKLSSNQKKMIKKMIQVSEIMDNIFWKQAYGDKNSFIESLKTPELKRYAEVNYGPWDRLQDNRPFVDGVGTKPIGANFYPKDMTKEEFSKLQNQEKSSLYTVVIRDSRGELKVVPYSKEYKAELDKASSLLLECAQLAKDPGLKKYLELRAKAFLSNDYFQSDLAWMDMKTNPIDFVVGPIENYEDKLYGYKTSFEGYVLIKDMEWSKKLEKFASFLPELQKGLPVENKYKTELPGTDSQLNAYDVVYYAGDCNAGSKTIAINLPNDERVQEQKGSRRLQLKNAMRAKYEKILVPISEVLIDPSQRQHITFDAFFANTMFHEVAHGLGIKGTINGRGTVRKALKEHASALEEGKADILGLYMVSQLHKKGEIDGKMEDYYTTFLAGIFRSVRFGAASAHGVANMIRFNFFKEHGAFQYDEASGYYMVNYEKMEEAMNALSAKILTLQGNGDYQGVAELVKSHGKITYDLQKDLDRIDDANIPTDVIFNQGVEVLGL